MKNTQLRFFFFFSDGSTGSPPKNKTNRWQNKKKSFLFAVCILFYMQTRPKGTLKEEQKFLPMCSPQASQYSAYSDSKQPQQYGRPSFMM